MDNGVRVKPVQASFKWRVDLSLVQHEADAVRAGEYDQAGQQAIGRMSTCLAYTPARGDQLCFESGSGEFCVRARADARADNCHED